jgi:hypothetical protein
MDAAETLETVAKVSTVADALRDGTLKVRKEDEA